MSIYDQKPKIEPKWDNSTENSKNKSKFGKKFYAAIILGVISLILMFSAGCGAEGRINDDIAEGVCSESKVVSIDASERSDVVYVCDDGTVEVK